MGKPETDTGSCNGQKAGKATGRSVKLLMDSELEKPREGGGGEHPLRLNKKKKRKKKKKEKKRKKTKKGGG